MHFWHWFIATVLILGLAFLYLIFYGLLLFLKSIRTSPQFEGIWYGKDGRVKEKRPIERASGFLGDAEWQLRSNNPSLVRFKVSPRGIGKSEEREWEVSDFIEVSYESGDKKLIHFNIKGFDMNAALKIRGLMQMLNQAVTTGAINKSNADELETRMNEKVDKQIKQAKALVPFTPQSPVFHSCYLSMY